MEIVLKNGETVILEISSLILEYLEDYKGGIEKLEKDASGQKDENGYTKKTYALNYLIYALLASNYDKPLTYRQAIKLINIEDIPKILNFTIQNTPGLHLKSNEFAHIF